MLKELRHKEFKNGVVYALETEDGFPLEVTDTFLPNYTKDAINQNENVLHDYVLGDRTVGEALKIYNDLLVKSNEDRVFLLQNRLYFERAEVYKKLGFSPLSEEQIKDGIRFTPMSYRL